MEKPSTEAIKIALNSFGFPTSGDIAQIRVNATIGGFTAARAVVAVANLIDRCGSLEEALKKIGEVRVPFNSNGTEFAEGFSEGCDAALSEVSGLVKKVLSTYDGKDISGKTIPEQLVELGLTRPPEW